MGVPEPEVPSPNRQETEHPGGTVAVNVAVAGAGLGGSDGKRGYGCR